MHSCEAMAELGLCKKAKKIEKIKDNKLYFSEVDVLNGTHVLDIKPYVKQFDARDNTVSG